MCDSVKPNVKGLFPSADGARALDAFGLSDRLRLLQEELCEAAVEISHFERGRIYGRDHLAEEIADVLVMIDEVWTELGADVEPWIARKRARMLERIADRIAANEVQPSSYRRTGEAS